MRHIILFENFNLDINEQSNAMISGTSLYLNKKDLNPAVDKMEASIDKVKNKEEFTIYFNSGAKKQISKIVFSNDLDSEHKDTETKKIMKGIGLRTEVIKTGEGVDAKDTIKKSIFKGDNKDDISKALISFFASSGAFESDIIAINLINTILELNKKYSKQNPKSLKMTASIIINASKVPSENIIIAESPKESNLNKKLKIEASKFLKKLELA